MYRVLTVRIVMAVVAVVLCFPPAADAQYFGRNKVQWESFDFKVMETQHFDIYYYPDEEEAVQDVARMAERWYERLSKVFEHEFERKPIVLYADHPDFQQTTTTGGLIGEGTGGFTDSFKNRIVMPLTGSYADTDHVLGHEMVHVFQYDIARTYTSTQRGQFQLQRLPLWMIEGLAEYLSQGRVDNQTAMWMRDAAYFDNLPDFRTLNRDPRFTPYQFGQGIWAYIGGRWGDRAVIQIFVGSGIVGIEQAFLRVIDMSPEEVFEEWHAATKEFYQPVIEGRRDPGNIGEALLTKASTRADLNIAPSLSPNGDLVAFLSTRDLFSIDLFLADARTGEVKRRLVSASADPHFDALRFLDSAGSWSPDGRKLAFVVFEEGDNTVAILNVDNGRIEKRIEISTVGAVTSPSWSPDGRTLVFSGQKGGITDLYLLDTETSAVRQITSDRYADMQPVFSPDGSRIAFSSDRGPGTDFEDLTYDPVSLAIYDVERGGIQVLQIFGDSKHINPQFSPDGQTIYFISNPEGVNDVYSYSLTDGTVRRITDVRTGVSGITEMSPALTVAANSGRMMFSVFENTNFNIYGFSPDLVPSEPVAPAGSGAPTIAEILPPAAPLQASPVEAYLRAPTRGLPAPVADIQADDYDPDLGLDFIGPPAIGVGTDRFGGVGFAGAISAYFSDVLGQHQVGVAVQTGGGGSDSNLSEQIGAQLIYLNRKNRINWGAGATHVPYVSERTVRVREEEVVIDDQLVLVTAIDQLREVVTVDEAELLSQYPISLNRRLEAAASYVHLGFDSEIRTFFLSGNRIIGRERQDFQDFPSIAYYTGSAAYVGDTSTFGFISPVRGHRFRFEVEGTGGDLQFQTALADYRQYLFFRPVTFAFRGMHYGRYGSDAEDPRLSRLFLGHQTLVRGYDTGSFSVEECTTTGDSNACPEFDRLTGSKIGVVNLEVRAPLFGPEEFGLFELEFLPTEMLAFIDGGVAWTENEDPTFEYAEETIERVPVFSAGVGVRMLLGGYLPLHFYYAYPFQRPDAGAEFGFTIAAGW